MWVINTFIKLLIIIKFYKLRDLKIKHKLLYSDKL